MYFKSLKIMTIWVGAVLLVACALLAPAISAGDQPQQASAGKDSIVARHDVQGARSARDAQLGDMAGLRTALDSRHDLTPAAGEHKKYILVKKKPKMKKIKMDVYEPKMKYKKIKMKIPIKKMKKKKVKGYLVKKEHGHGHGHY